MILGYDKGISIGYQKELPYKQYDNSIIRFGLGYSVGDFVIISPEPVDIKTKWRGIYSSVGINQYFHKYPHIGWNLQFSMIFRENNKPLPSFNIGFHYGIFSNK